LAVEQAGTPEARLLAELQAKLGTKRGQEVYDTMAGNWAWWRIPRSRADVWERDYGTPGVRESIEKARVRVTPYSDIRAGDRPIHNINIGVQQNTTTFGGRPASIGSPVNNGMDQ
jgi:hypothetical protein